MYLPDDAFTPTTSNISLLAVDRAQFDSMNKSFASHQFRYELLQLSCSILLQTKNMNQISVCAIHLSCTCSFTGWFECNEPTFVHVYDILGYRKVRMHVYKVYSYEK